MSTEHAGGTPPPEDDLSGLSEEELREAYEAELARIRVEDVLVQTVVSLLNLAARKAGLTGAEDEPDYDQVGQAIDATRALLPFVEPTLGAEAKQVRDALTQLQLAYTQSGATARRPPADEAEAPAAEPGGSGSAQSSGRLWVPGQ
jgi:multidrug efflux pump subunit AcrA (membrane-fusion protein)